MDNRPNILMVMADQLAFDNYACRGIDLRFDWYAWLV